MGLDVTAADADPGRNVAYKAVRSLSLRMTVQVLVGNIGGDFAVSSSPSIDQDHRTDCRPQVTGVNLLMLLIEPKRPPAGHLFMSSVV
jgi:hypothetical protein